MRLCDDNLLTVLGEAAGRPASASLAQRAASHIREIPELQREAAFPDGGFPIGAGGSGPGEQAARIGTGVPATGRRPRGKPRSCADDA